MLRIQTVLDPRPRNQVLDTYWWFAAERQKIFFRRVKGDEAPWTTNRVLQDFKFCNSYRASDRVSQYLIREVIYGAPKGTNADDLLLRIVFFRLFSKPSTWELVQENVGPISRRSFNAEKINSLLDRTTEERQSIYTGAFILCANRAYGYQRKHRNHMALLADMFSYRRLPKAVARCKSLQELYETLATWPLIGPFMAYQLAIDINYSELVDFSEDEFTVPGPGALRGIEKCFVDLGDRDPAYVIHLMVAKQEEEFDRLEIPFEDLFGRPLHAIDCQNLFCEVDKFAREEFPELRSNRSRIKTRFRQTPDPLPLFYPPKWKLNYGRGKRPSLKGSQGEDPRGGASPLRSAA